MTFQLGIDLGTTFSTAAVLRDGRVEVLTLGTRSSAVPTVVFVRDDGVVLVGEAAEARGVGEPDRVAREFKRRLGDPTPLVLGGAPYGAERLAAYVLEHIVARATERMGGRPSSVVITHPASYSTYRLDLLREAAVLAGCGDALLLPEPQAAAWHYAHDHRVEWLGRVTDADKIARLKGATVFCAPSLHGESFGVVLVEAMAADTAIVASGLDGYRNVATDGVDSVLVEPGDVDALAGALRRVLYDDSLRRSLVAAGGPRADQFSMHRLAELYAAHYERIAADREVRRRMLDDARERRRVSRMLARALGRP